MTNSTVEQIENFDLEDFMSKLPEISTNTEDKFSVSLEEQIDKSNVNFEKVCPQWMKFLNEIFENNQEMINYVQKLMGMLLSDYNVEQQFYLLYGTGANGKSVFTEILIKLAEKDIAIIEPLVLTNPNYKFSESDYKKLTDAKIVLISEPNKNDKFYSRTIKLITGGDTLTYTNSKGEEIRFKANAKLIMMSNFLPKFDEQNYALERRLCIVPFNRTFAPFERDKYLLSKLEKELESIKLWTDVGCMKWQYDPCFEEPEGILNTAIVQQWNERTDYKFSSFISLLKRDYKAAFTIEDILETGLSKRIFPWDTFGLTSEHSKLLGKLLTSLALPSTDIINRKKIYYGINVNTKAIASVWLKAYGDFSFENQIKRLEAKNRDDDKRFIELYKQKLADYNEKMRQKLEMLNIDEPVTLN